MLEFTTPASAIRAALVNYGGSLSDSMSIVQNLVECGWADEIVIEFPSMHHAASWADTYEIANQVNLFIVPAHFNEPITVRYAFKGE